MNLLIKFLNQMCMEGILIFHTIFILFCSGCEQNGSQQSLEFRNKLAGSWSFIRIKDDNTKFDTTFLPYNETISIPTVLDQTENNDNCLVNLMNGFSVFEMQAFLDEKNKPSFISLYNNSNHVSPLNESYIRGTWEITNFKYGESMQWYKYVRVNGVKKETTIDLIYQK